MISESKRVLSFMISRLTKMPPVLSFWALALGVVMPVASAMFYPTYHVMMPQSFFETTRLIETPYVMLEIAFIFWVCSTDFKFNRALKEIRSDLKIAAVIQVTSMFIGVMFIAVNSAYALVHSILWMIHIAFAVCLAFQLSRARRSSADSDGFLAWHAIGLVVLAVFTAWRFLTPPPADELPFGEILWRGAIPGFIDVRHLGSWTGALAAGFAIRILFGRSDRGLWWSSLFYFLAAGMTVWSGTRAAILAMVCVSILFIISLGRWPDWRRVGWAALLTVIACGAAYILIWDRPPFWLITPSELSSAEELTQTRTILWSRTVELWLQSPWLGLGTGSIFWEYGSGMTPTQPHNVVLQFLVSWGLVGALAGFWIIFRVLLTVHRTGIVHPELFALLGVFHALMFQSLLEGMLHYPRFIIQIIVVGLIIFCSGDRRRETGNEALAIG